MHVKFERVILKSFPQHNGPKRKFAFDLKLEMSKVKVKTRVPIDSAHQGVYSCEV